MQRRQPQADQWVLTLDVNGEALRGLDPARVQTALNVLRAAQSNCSDVHGPSDND